MQKHPRQVFGIVEDGLGLSLVHIFRENNQLYVDSVERVRLDHPIYQEEAAAAAQSPSDNPMDWEEGEPDKFEFQEIEKDLPTSFGTDPYHSLLGQHQVRWGVMALNVNDENLVRIRESGFKNFSLKRIVREHIEEHHYKAGEWQHAIINVNHKEELWVHQGKNRHLDQLLSYQLRFKTKLFFQLADANDIVLADYFGMLTKEIDKRIMLVCLGQEYRKVLVFEHGIWKDTLLVQITQERPEPEVIYSKLALCIDSSPYSNPDSIVLCGELINRDVTDFLISQFDPIEVSLLGFPHLTVTSHKAETYEASNLASYALPLCLAMKAMNPEATYHSPSNFLPTSITEGQKVFKIAWHGLIILLLVFLSTTFFTTAMLRSVTDFNSAKRENARLEAEFVRKTQEAKEIEEIRTRLDMQQQNLDAIKVILEGKNPWSHLMDMVNRSFARHNTSWLQSMALDSGRLKIIGTTTNRRNVLHFADLLPESHIKHINAAKMRDIDVWHFEISSDLPKVDWANRIDEEYRRIREEREAMGFAAQSVAANGETGAVPSSLRPIPDQYLLVATANQLAADEAASRDYQAFIRSAQSRNQWQYRELGQGFLQKHRSSVLAPIVRWRTAHRFYVDEQYDYATQYLAPMLQSRDDYFPYVQLLAARIAVAKGNNTYTNHYRILKRDYPLNPLSAVFNEDLRILGD